MATQKGTYQNFRNATAGARPGANGLRALLDGEFFVNTKDGVLCYLNDQGVMQTAFFLNAAGMTALIATLPTSPPTPGSGVLWNDAGVLTVA